MGCSGDLWGRTCRGSMRPRRCSCLISRRGWSWGCSGEGVGRECGVRVLGCGGSTVVASRHPHTPTPLTQTVRNHSSTTYNNHSTSSPFPHPQPRPHGHEPSPRRMDRQRRPWPRPRPRTQPGQEAIHTLSMPGEDGWGEWDSTLTHSIPTHPLTHFITHTPSPVPTLTYPPPPTPPPLTGGVRADAAV